MLVDMSGLAPLDKRIADFRSSFIDSISKLYGNFKNGSFTDVINGLRNNFGNLLDFDIMNSVGIDWGNRVFYWKSGSIQKNYGYSDFYDDGAGVLGMVLDTRIVAFEYENTNYRIQFWKGSYNALGIAGGEIGVYVKEDESSFYECADESEYLNMTMQIVSDNGSFTRGAEDTYWINGFQVGNTSSYDEITMYAKIVFPNEGMKNAFIEAFKNEYGEDENMSYSENENTKNAVNISWRREKKDDK